VDPHLAESGIRIKAQLAAAGEQMLGGTFCANAFLGAQLLEPGGAIP
jgi:hypothetical protein